MPRRTRTDWTALCLQTIHQARAEVAHGAGRQLRLASSDECILPDVKAHLRLQHREDKDPSSSPMLRQDRVTLRQLLVQITSAIQCSG